MRETAYKNNISFEQSNLKSDSGNKFNKCDTREKNDF